MESKKGGMIRMSVSSPFPTVLFQRAWLMELLRADSLLDLVAKPGGGATALPLDDSVEQALYQ